MDEGKEKTPRPPKPRAPLSSIGDTNRHISASELRAALPEVSRRPVPRLISPPVIPLAIAEPAPAERQYLIYYTSDGTRLLYEMYSNKYFLGNCKNLGCSCLGTNFHSNKGQPQSHELCSECHHSYRSHESAFSRTGAIQSWASPPDIVNNSSRESTVTEMVRRMLNRRVVILRGTPATGKTYLLTLIIEHLKKHHKIIVPFFTGGYKMIAAGGAELMLPAAFGANFEELYTCNDKCLLLDDGELTFQDDFFWGTLMKAVNQKQRGLYIVISTAYGSASHVVNPMTVQTPSAFADAEHFTLKLGSLGSGGGAKDIFLNLTDQEVEEVVKLHVTQVPWLNGFEPELIEFIKEFTACHAGAFKAMLDVCTEDTAVKTRCMTSNDRIITLSIADDELFSPFDTQRLRDALKGKTAILRSVPENAEIQDLAQNKIYREVVCEGQSFKRDDEAWKQLYKSGRLHRVLINYKEALVFPTPLHKWLVADAFIPQMQFPDFEKYPTPLRLCTAIVAGFSAAQLRGAAANVVDPPEAQYQQEFYRCCLALLAGRCNVSVEYGCKTKGDGKVDFFLPAYQWAIELVANGDKLAEHHGRFTNGKYHKYLMSGKFTDYIVLDFRVRRPQKAHPDLQKLNHVVLADDFRNVCILDCNLKVLAEFALKENL